uniref:NOT2/NOT3/NOT5 C-terminal domain-containing protein n=1 Tax=Amphimedon queenslandica TaxID=400682 RepID=A0A1X7T5U7_AMPQE
DLTTLGLHLNSPESLYSTFSSPFADSPSRPQDIDYPVPQEYLIHSYIRDKLAPIRLSKYNEDLLFYLYYTSGGDLLQLLAAHELYTRDWRYHKEEKIWITRAPNMRPTKVETTYEEGTYCYFDLGTWRKAHRDMKETKSRLHCLEMEGWFIGRVAYKVDKEMVKFILRDTGITSHDWTKLLLLMKRAQGPASMEEYSPHENR